MDEAIASTVGGLTSGWAAGGGWGGDWAVAAGVVSWAGARVARGFALRRGLLDRPNERSSHRVPTPRLGGLGIVLAVTAAAVAAAPRAGGALGVGGYPVAVALVAVGVAGVSLVDDLRSLPALVRFAVHFAAAGVVLALHPARDVLTLPLVPENLTPTVLTLGVLTIWIVGLLNATNFMDGIDGIAGAQALVAGLAWAVLGELAGAPWTAACGWSLAGAAAGFLVLNWSPASIFMGDVGSAFLGFWMAVLPVSAVAEVEPGRVGAGLLLAAGALAVWPFVLDALYTFLRRLRRGENVLAPHRSHLYQRLVISGLSHATVARAFGGAAAVGAAAGIGLVAGGGTLATWLAGLAVAGGGFLGLRLWCGRRERGAGARAAGQS